jgi:uncharacterized protein HemY
MIEDPNDEESWKVWSQRENRVIFAIVNRLLREKDYTTAIQLFGHTLQKDPNDPYLLSALGRMFFLVSLFHHSSTFLLYSLLILVYIF